MICLQTRFGLRAADSPHKSPPFSAGNIYAFFTRKLFYL